MKLFVSAYACEPGLGSEIGVGWHWVLELSRSFDLWVLTRESNRHTIEPWIQEHPEYSHIHWLYYDLPRWARWWKKGLRGVRTYYNLWQLCTNRIVRETMQANDIHVFHHLTYGNALWKVSSYGQKQYFIWGPIGGLETIPAEYTKSYPLAWRFIEYWRRMIARVFPYSYSFRKRCANADLILCKTEITRIKIPLSYRSKSVLMTDVAIDDIHTSIASECKRNGEITFLTVGRLQPWRGFDLCLEAFSLAYQSRPNIHMVVIGGGPYLLRLKRMAQSLGIYDVVTFLGEVSKDVYESYLVSSDVIVNAALKEGGVTFSFDALCVGKPVICLNTSGYTTHFDGSHSCIIEIGHRKQTIDKLAGAIKLLTDGKTRCEYGIKAREKASMLTWQIHGEDIRNLIASKIPECN